MSAPIDVNWPPNRPSTAGRPIAALMNTGTSLGAPTSSGLRIVGPDQPDRAHVPPRVGGFAGGRAARPAVAAVE